MSNNIAKVSISINANVNVSEQMKDKIKNSFPRLYEQYKNDDEGLAMVALFAAMDLVMPTELVWGDLINNFSLS